MQILIDDRLMQSIVTAQMSVQEVARQALASFSISDERRLVVGLYCDGILVSEDRVEAVLAAPAEHYQQLNFQTQPLSSLITDLGGQISAVIGNAKISAAQVAALLEEGNTQGALKLFKELIGSLEEVQQATQGYLEALALAGDRVVTTAAAISEQCGRYKQIVGELSQALVARDFVTMQDLLRYDLPELMDAWAEVLRLDP